MLQGPGTEYSCWPAMLQGPGTEYSCWPAMLQGPGTERSAEEAGRDDFTVTEGAVRRFIIDCNLNTKAANCLLGSGLPLYIHMYKLGSGLINPFKLSSMPTWIFTSLSIKSVPPDKVDRYRDTDTGSAWLIWIPGHRTMCSIVVLKSVSASWVLFGPRDRQAWRRFIRLQLNVLYSADAHLQSMWQTSHIHYTSSLSGFVSS